MSDGVGPKLQILSELLYHEFYFVDEGSLREGGVGAVRDGELEAVRGLVQASRLVSQSDEARLGVQIVGVLVVTRHYHVLQLRDVRRVAVTRFHLSVNNISCVIITSSIILHGCSRQSIKVHRKSFVDPKNVLCVVFIARRIKQSKHACRDVTKV